MQGQLSKTPLNQWHVAHRAKMSQFKGWEMPIWYPSGAVAEHRAVITNAGLFDTSHMAVVLISGPDAFELLQLCLTKDLACCVGKARQPLTPGKCVYGAYLNETGGVIDDTIVCQLSPEVYASIVNAGMGGEIARHLESHRADRNVQIKDLTGKAGKMDLQGPLSAKILLKVLKRGEEVLRGMLYFNFKGHFEAESLLSDTFLTDGTPVLLSRTGFTGEFGFELFLPPDRMVKAWEMILSAGEGLGLIPCGLAARDSVRTGAVLPLSHQDIGSWPFINHPWPFALPFTEDGTAFTKKFIGDSVLAKREQAEHTHAFVGYDPRKVSIDDPAIVLDAGGNEIGVVLTCVIDMAVGRYGDRIYSIASPDKPVDFKPNGLCCGFVKVKHPLEEGQTVELMDRRRKITAVIVNDIRPDRTARRPIREMM